MVTALYSFKRINFASFANLMNRGQIEIMSPVGSFETLQAAIQGGAKSVYFGVGHLNMRSRSTQNFTEEDLDEIVRICSENDIRSYITLNTIIFDDEMDAMRRIADLARKKGVSAVIASDLSVLQYARNIGLEVHMSTQTNITNSEAVKFYSQFADVMVTARELNLGQVRAITKTIASENITGPSGKPVQIEVFVHGALCMAVSGKCYLSLDNMNSSANRGACLQLCRRGYTVKDKDGEFELDIENEYIMSPKDLKTIDFLDKILDAGVTVLKIEGRGRSADYVKTVTQCYREAVEAVNDESFSPEKLEDWNRRLSKVYNRGFWDGYYLGRKMGEWSNTYGSQATKRKVYVGKIMNYYHKVRVAEIMIETQSISLGDDFLVIGPKTGVIEGKVSEIRVEEKQTNRAVRGDLCTIPINDILRPSDKLYRWEDIDVS